MPQINGIVGAEIPYYSMIKKAMPKVKPKKKKFKNHRITEIDPKTKKPRLKQGITVERAAEVLFMFENTDLLPNEIEDLKVTVESLRQRVMKLEDWQE